MTDTTTPPRAPEQRTVDVSVEALDTRGRTLHGYAAVYGAESGDLGGFRERIAPGAFANVLDADVRALLNHDPNQVLGRTRSGTLRLADEARGLRFEIDLPDSPLGENVRAAVARGDIDGASFRFVVGEEDWDGELRTVRSVRELHDVTVATYGAYPAASVELRTRPEPENTTNGHEAEEDTMQAEDRQENPGRGLAVEDRTADTPTIEQRVLAGLRAVRKGEARSLATSGAEPIAPPELSTFLFDRLRASSVALASGIRVVATDRESIQWPQITADMTSGWYAEADTITASDPTFATLTATPRKLAARVEASNEVIDDSDPSILDVLNGHVATILALRLDLAVFEGNPSSDPQSIRGLKYVSGIQSISMGTDGAALADYDPIIEAVGKLQAANVPGPYAAVMNPRTATELALLKQQTGSNEQLAAPAAMPAVHTTSQLSVTETKGTANNASSIYVYAPAQLVLVRRQDATIELDRSRLFDSDQLEMRGKLRADLLVPTPAVVVRIDGVIPPA